MAEPADDGDDENVDRGVDARPSPARSDVSQTMRMPPSAAISAAKA